MTLRNHSLLIFLLNLSLAGAASATVVGTTAEVSVNGGAYVSIPLQTAGKPSLYCAGEQGCSAPAITGPGYSIQIDVSFNQDPSIQYGVAVTNTSTSAMNFSFLFSQPISSTPTPGSVTASLSGSTTKGGGNPGVVTVTPQAAPAGVPGDPDNPPGNQLQVFTLSTTGGPPLTNAGLDLGPAFSSNPTLTSDTYGPFNEGPQAGPIASGLYNFMRLDLNFSLSGNGDVFTFNGSALVTPEPEIAALLGLGLIALGYAGRRRRH